MLKKELKVKQLNRLFDEICSLGLTPNEYFALSRVLQDKPMQERMDPKLYRRYLFVNDWITIENKPTEKLRKSKIFEDVQDPDFEKNVEIYRLMWPPITLPTGKTARSSSVDLQHRFRWFFENYQYNWDAIFQATESYINFYRERSYAYMRTSSYFIYKEETTKLRTSTLAEWCDRIGDGVVEHNYHIDV